MATSFTTNVAFAKPANSDTGWDVPINANADLLDGMAAIGGLCVATHESPSSTLNVRVSAGSYVKANGTVGTFAGATSLTLPASSTVCLWLTDSGTLTTGASFPSAAHVRLATVVTDGSTITSITDARVTTQIMGTGLGFLPLTGGTFTDVSAVVILTTGTTNGVEFGSAASDKLGFHGTTPTAQRSGAAQAALTDSTTGTAGTTVSSVGASFSQSTLNNNFASMLNLLNELRAAMVAKGLIKGSA
jgi:hypothetical protein